MTVHRARTPDPRQFAERMGIFFESEGFPRIAGRVFGLLLVSDEPRSLDALAATLGVSKASISTDSRLLERRGLVERVSQPGDRRVYYQTVIDLPHHAMSLRLERLRKFRAIIAGARAEGLAPDRETTRRLRALDLAYGQLIGATSATIARWEQGARSAQTLKRKSITSPSRTT